MPSWTESLSGPLYEDKQNDTPLFEINENH